MVQREARVPAGMREVEERLPLRLTRMTWANLLRKIIGNHQYPTSSPLSKSLQKHIYMDKMGSRTVGGRKTRAVGWELDPAPSIYLMLRQAGENVYADETR